MNGAFFSETASSSLGGPTGLESPSFFQRQVAVLITIESIEPGPESLRKFGPAQLLILIAVEPHENFINLLVAPLRRLSASAGASNVLLRPATSRDTRQEVLDISKQHLIEGLLPPTDSCPGVRIGGITGRVIKPGRESQRIASLQGSWLGIAIQQLPVEVIAGDVEQCLNISCAVDHLVTAGGTAEVEVRQKSQNSGIDGEFE